MSSVEIKDDVTVGAGNQDATDALLSAANNVEVKVAEHAKSKGRAPATKVVEIGDDVIDATVSVSVSAKNHDDQLSGKKVRVTFMDQNEEDGDKPIFASLNGYAYQIPRGIPVAIPVELLEVFENAQSELLSTDKVGLVKKRTTMRFQYSVHGTAA